MSKVLLVHDGKRERELLLVERLVVGRDPACDISFDDGLLSRRHAEFVVASSAVTVRDLGSRNGIFINGTRRVEQALKPGDVVQIGPLRVWYLRDHAATPGSSPVDLDGTRMLAATPAPVESVLKAPRGASFDVFRPASPAVADALDDGEGETRVISGEPFTHAARAAAVADDDATGFTPTPGPASPPLVAAETPRESAVAVPGGEAPSLASFVLIQLGALAVIVFVATGAPVILSRGSVLSAIDDGSITALLVWPILPLVIGFAATLVIASIVNRRVMNAVAAGRQDAGGR